MNRHNRTPLYPAILFALGLGAAQATAGELAEVEPNNTIAGAQSLDAAFSTGPNPDILNAETWPWVSIEATGDGSFDLYSFTVPATGVIGIFDIDYGYRRRGDIDTMVFLYDSEGNFLAEDDDDYTGDPGSANYRDSLLEYTFSAPGTYVIAVGEYESFGQTGGPAGNTPDSGDSYRLQVSLSEFFVDSDGDGVVDDEDCQPYSDLNPTVSIAGCDTGVGNSLLENGCSVADLVFYCADDSRNHGSFSSCVATTGNQLRKEGLLSGRESGDLQSCAARSDTGK